MTNTIGTDQPSYSAHATTMHVRAVGVLFLLQMTAAVLSYSVILEPILYSQNFLANVASNPTGVRLAALLDLTTGASVLGIAVLLYPILKHHSERIALWYVAQRLFELVGLMVTGILALTLLAVAQQAAQAPATESFPLQTLADSLREARGNTLDLNLLVYCLGAWAFYYLLFRSRLLPRFISVWGLAGVTLLFAEILSNVFGTSLGGMMIMMPLGLNEIFLGFWLIVRGFSPTALKPGT